MGGLLDDLRYGVRRLAASPGFSAAAALTLALGIGANVAVFSVVSGVMLRPLPLPEPERLVFITREGDVSIPDGKDWRESSRTLGVRMALGAEARDLLRLVVSRGLRLTLLGLAAGSILALALGRVVASLLYEVAPNDPAAFAAAALLLAATALLACYLPARRASRLDPMVALRYE